MWDLLLFAFLYLKIYRRLVYGLLTLDYFVKLC